MNEKLSSSFTDKNQHHTFITKTVIFNVINWYKTF